ncbi:hypothetical protein, partial [Micromonospora sp. NPDC000018]
MSGHDDLDLVAAVAAVLCHRLSAATSVAVHGPRGDVLVRVCPDSTLTEVREQARRRQQEPVSADVVLAAPTTGRPGAEAVLAGVPVRFARHHGEPAYLQERLDTLHAWLTAHPDRPVREA